MQPKFRFDAYVPRADYAATVEQIISWLLPREIEVEAPVVRKPAVP